MNITNNDEDWEKAGNTIRKIIPKINPGEIKEYTVVLNCNTTENNMGEKNSIISIVDTQNVPGFVDNNEEDNTSIATVIITVATGERQLGLTIVLIVLALLEAVTLGCVVALTKRQKENKIYKE